MKFLKNTTQLALALVLTVLIFSSCKRFEGDITVPAYLHLDRIDVTPQSSNAPSVEPGFYTSDIDAVEVICYFEGDNAETVLGVFQLPCTMPILHDGPIEYITINPVVKQNGLSGTRIYYAFYEPIRLTDITVSPNDTTNLGTLDPTANEWTLETHYYTKERINVLSEDFFEPTSFLTHFDSTVTWVTDDPENACTGKGYGLIHIADSEETRTFSIKDEFSPTSTQILYLEMDYKTDVDLYVNMIGFQVSSEGAATTKSVMCLYPTKTWKKIYINLGRTWSQFYYNTPLSIFFQAANTEGIEGDILLDNVKIITL